MVLSETAQEIWLSEETADLASVISKDKATHRNQHRHLKDRPRESSERFVAVGLALAGLQGAIFGPLGRRMCRSTDRKPIRQVELWHPRVELCKRNHFEGYHLYRQECIESKQMGARKRSFSGSTRAQIRYLGASSPASTTPQREIYAT
jgi:hypothetical protein